MLGTLWTDSTMPSPKCSDGQDRPETRERAWGAAWSGLCPEEGDEHTEVGGLQGIEAQREG